MYFVYKKVLFLNRENEYCINSKYFNCIVLDVCFYCCI